LFLSRPAHHSGSGDSTVEAARKISEAREKAGANTSDRRRPVEPENRPRPSRQMDRLWVAFRQGDIGAAVGTFPAPALSLNSLSFSTLFVVGFSTINVAAFRADAWGTLPHDRRDPKRNIQ